MRFASASTGLICDQTVVLTGFYSRQGFDTPLCRIKFKDPETGKTTGAQVPVDGGNDRVI